MSSSSFPQPQNRAQRRAAARQRADKSQNNAAHLDQSTIGIELARPDFDAKPQGKTLLQLAAERQALLDKGQPFPKQRRQQEHEQELDDDDDENEDDHPSADTTSSTTTTTTTTIAANAFLYSISLAMLHFTLDVMVLQQYSQDVVWSEIVGRVGRMLPALFITLWILHQPKVIERWRLPRQVFFLIASIACGCNLIYSGNRYGYYHVMKRAPPIGTLWVWSVVEMELLFALAHAVAVLGYMWWGGFGVF